MPPAERPYLMSCIVLWLAIFDSRIMTVVANNYIFTAVKLKFMDKGNDNPRTLLLVDVQWLNVQVDGFVEYMQRRIGRKLDDMDFVRLCVCALLDAGIERADGTVEVGLLDDSADGRLHHAVPADMSGELDGYAYDTMVGRIAFSLTPTLGLSSVADMCVDLAGQLLQMKALRHLVVLADAATCQAVADMVDKADEAPVLVRFANDGRETVDGHDVCQLAYPLLNAFGIRPEELD